MRLLALASLVALPAAAQTISSLQVLADSPKVISGRQTRVRAFARDPGGALIDLSWRWTVSDANLASVGPDGTVTGRMPGIVRVRATAPNGSFAESPVQILPGRLEIDPPSAEMTVGERRQFTVRVLDADGGPLNNVALRWQVLSGAGFNSNAGSVTNGMVRAISEGQLIVRAAVVYGTYIPGFQNEVIVDAPLRVVPPRAFRMRRVFNGFNVPPVRKIFFKPTAMSGNDAGELLYTTSFDGLASGLVTLRNGKVDLVMGAGLPGVTQSSIIYEFYNFAINSKSDVVAVGAMIGSGNVLWRGNPGGLEPFLWDNMLVGGLYEGLSGLRLSRCPLAEDGSVAFQANFRNVGVPAVYNGLFHMDRHGGVRLVASNQEPIEALGGIPVFDADAYGPAPDESVYFLASSGARRGLFRQRLSEPPQKLLATGDAFNGGVINAFMGSGMFWVARNGDVVFGVQATNGNFLVRLPAGRLDQAQTLRLSGWNSVQMVHPRHGVLFQGSEQGQPNGLYLWNGESRRNIFVTGRTQVGGAAIDAMDGAAIDAGGAVTAIVRTAKAPQVLARFSGDDPLVLSRTGDDAQVLVPNGAWGLVQGGKQGGPHLLSSGFNSSIFEVTPEGPRLVVPTGEQIAGAWRFTGAATWNTRRGNDGHLYVTQTTGYGLARKEAGKPLTQVIPASRRVDDGATVGGPSEVRVNVKGELLTTHATDRGDSRLVYTTPAGAVTVVSNNGSFSIDGFGTIVSWSDQVFDDRGRVLAILRNRESAPGLGLWSQGKWSLVWRAGGRIDSRNVSSVANLKSMDDRFFFRVQLPGGVWAVVELRDEPRIALDVDEVGANGIQVVNVGIYDVNRNGEILFQSFAFGQTVYGVKTHAGFRHLHTNSTVTAEGDVLWRVVDMDLRDDGSAYLFFINLSDEAVLYRAEPL